MGPQKEEKDGGAVACLPNIDMGSRCILVYGIGAKGRGHRRWVGRGDATDLGGSGELRLTGSWGTGTGHCDGESSGRLRVRKHWTRFQTHRRLAARRKAELERTTVWHVVSASEDGASKLGKGDSRGRGGRGETRGRGQQSRFPD